MADKQIIVTFSDGYCIVLEDNKVSIRENEFTKLCIVVGNRTNELLEFVKNIYLDNKCKEQECERLKKEVELLKQYKGSKQASYERMQIDWNKAVSQNRDLLKQVEGWQDKYNQLKAEKEEIKKYLGISSKTIMERLEELQEFRDNDKYKLYLAEQTLTEIKEIAEPFCNACQEFEPEKKGRNCMYCNYGNILQKISEVIS